MSICSNCGTKLNVFTECYGINPDSLLCSKCREIITPIFNNEFKPNISTSWVNDNRVHLRSKGITESGIHEFEKYIRRQEEEIAKQEAKTLSEKQAKLKAAKESQFADSTLSSIALESLRVSGADGYYEYAVKSLIDEGGKTNLNAMVTLLNEMGLAGWRLVTSHTNELGKNALALAGLELNSTADETVLIFERFVRI